MKYKKIDIPADALAVLQQMSWAEDPNHGIIGYLPEGQLERALYVKVNKVLEALGGKWNRKVKGHVFKDDPRPEFEVALDDGVVLVAKDGYFPTPPEVVERMVALLGDHFGPYLEPSAGTGELLEAAIPLLGVKKEDFDTVELNEKRQDALRTKGYKVVGDDTLKHEGQYGTILMNPPFEDRQDAQHVIYAFENLLAPGGTLVSVISAGVIHGSDRHARKLRTLVDKHRGIFERLPDNSFKTSGTGVNSYLVKLTKNGA